MSVIPCLLSRQKELRPGFTDSACYSCNEGTKQKGSIDCGLLAIAVMTSLAHKEDPQVQCAKCQLHQVSAHN